MQQLINYLWEIPDFAEQRTRQQVDLLLVLLHVFAGFDAFILTVNLLLGRNPAARWLLFVGLVLIYGGVIFWLKRGRPVVAANLFLLGAWLLLTIGLNGTGGLFAIGLSTYSALIFAAGLLRNEWAALRLTIANIVASLALIYASSPLQLAPSGDLAPVRAIIFSNLLALLLTFFVVRRQTDVQKQLDRAHQELLAQNKAIHASAQRYRSLLEQSPFSTIICSPTGTIRYLNPAATRLWGIPEESLTLLVDQFNILTDPHLQQAGLDSQIERGFRAEPTTLPPIEYNLHHHFANVPLPTVGTRWLQGYIYPIRLAGDEIDEVVVMYEDVTERIEAEQAKWQAQKMEGIGLLAGGIAHDFNNILAAIMAQASVAQFQLEAEAPAQAALTKVITAAEQAANLTGQLLAYAGNKKYVPQTLDLNQLVTQNLHLFQLAIPRHVSLVSELTPEAVYVEADPGQLQQVIMNLLLNGAEAIQDQPGTVQLRTRRVLLNESDEHHFPLTGFTLPAGHYAILEVSDDGIGLDEATLSRIFEPFFSTKSTGRGLGLAAVHGIIQGHHGALDLDSTPGQGTRFTIYLPLSPREPAEVAATTTPDLQLPSGTTILTIDDELSVRQAMASILATTAATLLQAETGQDGLACYRAHQAEIDLVILDLTMPGMSGKETLQALHEIDPDLPVILCSGYSDADLASSPAIPFLPKPFKAVDLLRLVQQTLAAP